MSESLERIDPDWAWRPFTPAGGGDWNRRRAAHLFRRAAFGASAGELDAAVGQRPADVIEKLLSAPPESPIDGDELAKAVLATGDPKQLAAWWTYVLLNTKQPLRERMTLFWHGHFATGAEKVRDVSLMLEQNELLRRHALGDFRAMVHDISRDPAMLIYLDSATNRKSRANENYARELMELFCLGEGNYSERDVQQLARCFTGWEIKLGRFRFNGFQHDAGKKTILDRTDVFPEGSAIDWIVDQPQSARFIATKIFRHFVWEEPPPPAPLVEPLAAELRDHNWEISHVLRRVLNSQLFFSDHAVGRKIRSPVDLGVGLMRSLEASTNAHQLAEDMQQNGHGLFYPPNVKGWDGGRSWINSSTILGRANMVGRLLGSEHTRFAGQKLSEYVRRLGANTPEQTVDLLAEVLVAVPLAKSARAGLLALYAKTSDPAQAVSSVVHAMAALPEFQLA